MNGIALYQSVVRVIGLGVLLILACSCTGLAGEPGIIRTATLATITPVPPPDLGRPLQPPSLVRGSALFNNTQGCQACHGASGKGDGPTAASLPCKIPDLTDPAVARPAVVRDWFTIITDGKTGSQGCLMPPWKNRLNEQQRWDVTAYANSLHYSSTMLEAGRKAWTDNCAACHGTDGAGDGPKAKDLPRPVPNFRDPATVATHSDADLFASVTKGIGAVMPAFSDKLSEGDRWSVVAYLRSLSWEESLKPEDRPKPEITTNPDTVQIQPLRFLLEFPDSSTIHVQLGAAFVNQGPYLYTGGDGKSVRLALPKGASQIKLSSEANTGFTVTDGEMPLISSVDPLQPGESRPLVVDFLLPFKGQLDFIQPSLYDRSAIEIFFAENSGYVVRGSAFVAGQSVPLQDSAGKTVNYRSYRYDGTILGGLPLQFTLLPEQQALTEDNTARRLTLTAVLVAMVLAFAVVGYGVWRIRRAAS